MQHFLRLRRAIFRHLETNPFAEKSIHALVQSRDLALDEEWNACIDEQTFRHGELDLIVRFKHHNQRDWLLSRLSFLFRGHSEIQYTVEGAAR